MLARPRLPASRIVPRLITRKLDGRRAREKPATATVHVDRRRDCIGADPPLRGDNTLQRKKALLGTITAAIALLVATAAFAATINGTDGPDAINGTPGADTINGLGGDDTINGLGGRDRIDGGSDDDTINGDCSGGPTTGPYACIPGNAGNATSIDRRQRPRTRSTATAGGRPHQRPGRRRPPARQHSGNDRITGGSGTDVLDPAASGKDFLTGSGGRRQGLAAARAATTGSPAARAATCIEGGRQGQRRTTSVLVTAPATASTAARAGTRSRPTGSTRSRKNCERVKRRGGGR